MAGVERIEIRLAADAVPACSLDNLREICVDEARHHMDRFVKSIYDIGEILISINIVQRISVDHDLQPGAHDLCYGCGFPLSVEQKKHEKYRFGISCQRCSESQDETDLRDQASRRQQNFGVGQRHRKRN